MSLARRLGFRGEKDTLLERLPFEIREDLYRRVYHCTNTIRYKPLWLGAYGLVIGDTEIAISRLSIDATILEKFIKDIFQGKSSCVNTDRKPSLDYDSITDRVTISGHWTDENGWIHIRPQVFTVPVCIDLMQALLDLCNDLARDQRG